MRRRNTLDPYSTFAPKQLQVISCTLPRSR